MKGDVSGKDSLELDPLDPVSNPRTRQATRSVVFVLDASHRPLAPCHPARARRLLARQRAAVWRAQPFTLILRARTDIPPETVQDTLQDMAAGAMASDEHREAAEVPNGSPLTGTSTRAAVPSTTHSPAAALSPSFPPGQGYRLKIDPGSKTTGLALVQETRDSTGQAGQMGRVLWAAELTHRGDQVNERLTQRRQCRRSRRQRHTRYRPARYRNRRRRDGWLPPSLESRIQNVLTWVERLCRWCPIDAISLELVKFDTQLLHNPELSGIQYQQGTLAGYELREYLLEKWDRRCAYCKRTNVPLKVEHMRPRRRHGSNAIWNLTLACKPCNERKGTRTAAEFGFPELEATGRRPLRDAAAVNATRWALFRRLEALGLPLETGTGGQTKWNRTRRTLPKTHWLDAACVGASTPEMLQVSGVQPLTVKATGRHSRQMCRTNAYGFPDKAPKATSVVCGLRTGDIVRAVVPPPSVKAGTYVGRLAVRATGWCNIMTSAGTIQSIHVRYCNLLQRGDGYTYQVVTAALPPVLENRGLRE